MFPGLEVYRSVQNLHVQSVSITTKVVSSYLHTTLCDKVRRFSPGTPISSINKTEILVEFIAIKLVSISSINKTEILVEFIAIKLVSVRVYSLANQFLTKPWFNTFQ